MQGLRWLYVVLLLVVVGLAGYFFARTQYLEGLLTARPSPSPTPAAVAPPTATALLPVAPWPTATAYVVREYTERRADGSAWLVRQWSDGRFEDLRQVEPPYTPTPPTTSCRISVGSEFAGPLAGREYLRTALGCPTEAVVGNVWSAEEAFQFGVMLWRSYKEVVYVLTNDGAAARFDAASYPHLVFHEGEPESGGYTPPPGLFEPIRGFGKVWRLELGGPRARIGWATERERGLYSVVQDFEKGSLFRNDGGITYVILYNRQWYRFTGY